MDRDILHLIEGFAHELRTPLSALAGHSALLSLGVHGPVSDAQARALDRIESNKKQMISLIDSLVSYAEAMSGTTTYAATECALVPIVSQSIAALDQAALASGVRFDWAERAAAAGYGRDAGEASDSRVNERLRDVATINEHAARDVISILLENALIHSEHGSSVHVCLQRTSQSLRLNIESGARTVVDTALLFEPYARDAHGRPVHASGHALSLPRARAMARAMGAEVRARFVESRRVLEFEVVRSVNPTQSTG